MKLKKYLLLAFLVTGLCMFAGCKKEKTIIKTKAQLLTQKEWILVGLRYNIDNGSWIDDFVNFPACDKDDIFNFLANGNYNQNEGASKCDPSNPQVILQGTWVLSLNDTILSIFLSGQSSQSEATILQLDENTFKIMAQVDIGGQIEKDEYTFAHP